MVEGTRNSAGPGQGAGGLPAIRVRVHPRGWREGQARAADRSIPEETAVALVYDGATEAVMMATPADLEDFAIGFSLTEGLIRHPAEIRGLEILPMADGIEARLRSGTSHIRASIPSAMGRISRPRISAG